MKKSLSELTVEELKSKQKSLKLTSGLLLGMMIVLVASVVALIALKGSRAMVISLSAMPLIFLPVLISSKKTLKDIDVELGSRK